MFRERNRRVEPILIRIIFNFIQIIDDNVFDIFYYLDKKQNEFIFYLSFLLVNSNFKRNQNKNDNSKESVSRIKNSIKPKVFAQNEY